MKKKVLKIPSVELLEEELKNVRYRESYLRTLKSTIFALVSVAATTILIATLILPVFQIHGNSMTPTLEDGQLIISVKGSSFERGDIIAFYYNNKILVKRVIATSGEWFDIDESGDITVNGEILNEPYIKEKSKGDCNIALPYQVPEGKVFVMGDHRNISIDSRNTAVGCISEEQIIGKLTVRFWPLDSFGPVE